MATRTGKRGRPANPDLTDKQREIVALAAEGITAGQAAERLGIAGTGVYNHMTRIREKGHAIEFARNDEHPAADAAPTNGGTPSNDSEFTEAAKRMLGDDAEKYVSGLQKIHDECEVRRKEIADEIRTLTA